MRSMRTFNDENVAPDGPLNKTIHQRNKSSPAISTIASTHALKVAAKRTAFGDVSNIVPSTRSYKDESGIPVKSNTYGNTKLGQVVHEKKSAALLRPAQRPLSVSGLKNLLTSSSNNTATSNTNQSRTHLGDITSSQSISNGRKTLTKRATTIFKDTVLDTVQENESSEPPKPLLPEPQLSKLETAHSQVTVPQPDSRLYLPPPHTSSRPEPVKEELQVITEPSSGHNEPSLNNQMNATEAYIPAQVKSFHDHDSTTFNPLHQEDLSQQLAAAIATTIETVELEPLPITEPIILPQEIETHPGNMQLSSRVEPEEYWEEEDEDTYEEEGYVTARSFRSKGDNTTGGATAVLIPRMNQKARREIEAATQLVEATRTVEEIEDESFDTSMVAEYGDEIFEYMRQLETKMSPNPHYMDNQHEIQWSMRTVLMDWLVQVHHRFNLLPETLFLCVNYIDRFLSCKVVSLGKLQLVGATAIFIAAKYEEINCPSVQEIVYMVDGGYSMDEILKAERFMLTMLQFELGWPGPMSFLRRISKADDYDLETRTLAKYFLEVTLMDERFIGSPPSFTAAASHCLSRMMLRKGEWVSDIS